MKSQNIKNSRNILSELANDIPASIVSVRYQSIPVQDWVSLFRYRIGSGIGIFVILVPVLLLECSVAAQNVG
jgi:hypothetical protein